MTLSSESASPRILVVEDDVSLRELLCRNLHRHHFEAVPASDGEEAFLLFETGRVGAIVTDYAMPKMNGGQLARKIKAIAPEFPTVVVTGEAPDQEILELSALGNTITLLKPFQSAALIEALRHVLRLPLSHGEPDLRRSSRVESSVQALLENQSKGLIRNLCFGGCFIETALHAPVGAEIQLRFRGMDRYLIQAKVAWRRENDPVQPPGLGVLFLPSSPDVDLFLKKFVLSKLKQKGVGIMGSLRGSFTCPEAAPTVDPESS